MAEFTTFFNPMSRALIAHWALHEVGAEFDTVMVEWDNKPAALLAANPMGKLPTIIHHTASGDSVVSECAAICHYLADVTGSDLMPRPEEKAAYYRWLFFASGPMETAITNKAMGWEPADLKQETTVGFGSFDRVIDTLDKWLSSNDYAAGSRYTMADVYLGAQVDWGLRFGTVPDRDSFKAYQTKVRVRDAYGKSIGLMDG